MFVISLIFSTILWLPTLFGAFGSTMGAVPKVSSGVLILSVVGLLMGCLLPAVMLQAVLLLTGYVVWNWLKWSPRRFAFISTAALMISYGAAAISAASAVRNLQERFPVASIEQRLPLPPVNTTEIKLPKESLERLAVLEQERENQLERGWSRIRRDHLRMLHENTLAVFVSQPGFGAGRMTGIGTFTLRGRSQRDPMPQPGSPAVAAWSAGLFTEPAFNKSSSVSLWEKKLAPLHQHSELDFLDPVSYGYVRDRQFVVGFQSHKMQDFAPISDEWELRTVSLIGLVMHPEPVVYVSDHLPSMEELAKGTTIPPDDFEMAGLQSLRSGEDLFAHEQGGVLRAVGALRATKQCLQCHGGNRGDLLGAFSYNLTVKNSQDR